ncbi:12249_t:CDS:2, partial [Racocetra fulgida]
FFVKDNHKELQAELLLFLENIEEYNLLIEHENNPSIHHKKIIDPAQNSSTLEYNLNKSVTKIEHNNNTSIWHESVIDSAQNGSTLEHDLNKLVMKNELFLLFENTAECYPLEEHENNS